MENFDDNAVRFSVAMSVYKNDTPSFFDKALGSIYTDQTVKPSEIVLVVDGDVPSEINDVISKYADLYAEIFRVIRLSQNKGLGNALRVALDNCSFDIIARMDSDDISESDRFEQQLNVLINNSDIDIVGGDILEFIGSEDNTAAYRRVPLVDNEIKEQMKIRCAMNHVTVMYRKKSVEDAGGYLDWFCNEDYYLWIRMLKNECKFANTGTVLVKVRVGKDMYKRRGGFKYFTSEYGIQKYMINQAMISKKRFILNVIKRFIVQCLMPSGIRGAVFKAFAREKT